jgi:hypothetical protein
MSKKTTVIPLKVKPFYTDFLQFTLKDISPL